MKEFPYMDPQAVREAQPSPMATELQWKPCPFCGSDNINRDRHPGAGRGMWHRGQDVFSVGCNECGGSVPSRYSIELLNEAWNRRPDVGVTVTLLAGPHPPEPLQPGDLGVLADGVPACVADLPGIAREAAMRAALDALENSLDNFPANVRHRNAIEALRVALGVEDPDRQSMPLMQSAFRTTVSYGPDGLYEMRFKFTSLAAMQAADAEWRAHVSGGKEPDHG